MKASIRQLMEAGVHFGHKPSQWNPKMRPYIYGEHNGIHIIDLNMTIQALNAACQFMRKSARLKKNIVFVATKQRANKIV